MRISYVRSYYGVLDRTAVPPPEVVALAERTRVMLHPERTHEWTTTEPFCKSMTRQLAGPVGWLVTFSPEAS